MGNESRPEVKPDLETHPPENFLVAVFKEPQFIGYIKELARHARKNLSEGGFVVYKKNDEHKISGLLKSPKLTSYESRDEAWRTVDRKLTHKRNPVYDWTSKVPLDSVRKDLVLQVHSHPLDIHDPRDTPARLLRPSEADLRNWEECRIGVPGIIEGIMVSDGKTAQLLLYQSNQSMKQNTYYQQWREDESVEKLYRLMTESGINHTILCLDHNSDQWREEEIQKLDRFAA